MIFKDLTPYMPLFVTGSVACTPCSPGSFNSSNGVYQYVWMQIRACLLSWFKFDICRFACAFIEWFTCDFCMLSTVTPDLTCSLQVPQHAHFVLLERTLTQLVSAVLEYSAWFRPCGNRWSVWWSKGTMAAWWTSSFFYGSRSYRK